MHWGPAHGKPWPKLGVEGYDSCDSISHKLRPRYSAEAARSDWGCSPPLVVSPELSLKSGHPEERAGASGQGYGPRTWSGTELRAQPQGCHGEAGVSLGGSLNLNFLICQWAQARHCARCWGKGREQKYQPVDSRGSIPVTGTEGFP